MSAGVAPVSVGSWAIPAKALRTSVVLLVVLVVPVALAAVAVGSQAALPMALAEVMCLTAAAKLTPRFAPQLVAVVAVTAAVAVSLNGQAFPAACFAVLVCLMVAPANMYEVGLLTAVPPIAAVFLASPGLTLDPAPTALWAFLGGLFVVVLLARVAPPSRRHPISAATAFRHAAVMAVAMGASVFLVIHFEVARGYWVPMTMAFVLQPFGSETRARARQRIFGTVGGGLLALALAFVLPGGVVAVVLVPLIVLGVAYSILGRYSKSVMFLTPSVVLLANLASRDAEVSATVQRVAATLIGGVVAAALALLLDRADTDAAPPTAPQPAHLE
jgi:hypothetical protein